VKMSAIISYINTPDLARSPDGATYNAAISKLLYAVMLFQMLLAYCHLLLALAALISHLSISATAPITGANPTVRQTTTRYDPDAESLNVPYDLHMVGSGNHDDGVTTSRQDNGCRVTTEPARIPSEAAVEDFLQSHSI